MADKPKLSKPVDAVLRAAIDTAIEGSPALGITGVDANKDGKLDHEELSFAIRRIISLTPKFYVTGLLGKANTALTKPLSDEADAAKEKLKGDKAIMDTIMDELKVKFPNGIEPLTRSDFSCILRTAADRLDRDDQWIWQREGFAMEVPFKCPAKQPAGRDK